MAVDFIEPMCEKFLADYMAGRYGFNGVLQHEAYRVISRRMRTIIRQRDLPLIVYGTHGRVIVNIEPEKLALRERQLYDEANRALTDSAFTGIRPSVVWPLAR